MTSSNDHSGPAIDKRDFDANRPLLQDEDEDGYNEDRNQRPSRSRTTSYRSRLSGDRRLSRQSDDGLLNEVVEGIVERDRQKMQREVIRAISFAWGVITWYVHNCVLITTHFCFCADGLAPQSRRREYHCILFVRTSAADSTSLYPITSQYGVNRSRDSHVSFCTAVWIHV